MDIEAWVVDLGFLHLHGGACDRAFGSEGSEFSDGFEAFHVMLGVCTTCMCLLQVQATTPGRSGGKHRPGQDSWPLACFPVGCCALFYIVQSYTIQVL